MSKQLAALCGILKRVTHYSPDAASAAELATRLIA